MTTLAAVFGMMPGAAGSARPRAPSRTITSSKMPWYEPANTAMRSRPVTVRAMRTQPITASEPVLHSAARSKPVISQTSSVTGPASGCCGPIS